MASTATLVALAGSPSTLAAGNRNMSMHEELLLMTDQFGAVGECCIAAVRFLGLWLFPLLLFVSHFLASDAAAAALRWLLRQLMSLPTPDNVATLQAVLLEAQQVAAPALPVAAAPSSTTAVEAAGAARFATQQKRPAEATEAPVAAGAGSAPRHIAVIMDGNRRFGKQRLGSSLLGHRAGGEKLREFVRWCRRAGVEMLTVYAFSTENWSRPQREVDLLMDLFASFFEQMLVDAREIGIRIRFISSEPERLPPGIRDLMRRVELATREHGDGICVNVCVSYGSRSAVARAVADDELMRLVRGASRAPCAAAAAASARCDDPLMRRLAMSMVEEEETRAAGAVRSPLAERDAALWATPDMLVRTSGEMRLSNFMLLEAAYAEMFFWDVTWPEVTEAMLARSIAEFSAVRCRRMGA
jgi:undecaprenyl pyrophosphate synthase